MNHAVHSVLVIILIHALSSQYDAVCIWGRKGDNAQINGEYTALGTMHEKPFYQKIAPDGCSTSKLYWATGLGVDAWLIHNNTDLWNSLAWCPLLRLMDCDTWRVEEYAPFNTTFNDTNTTYRFTLDSSVHVLNGSCPLHVWQCDKVHIPSLSFPCNVVFDDHISENTWFNSTYNVYWYWNEWSFNWKCDTRSPTINLTQCSYDHSDAWTKQGWSDIANGESASLSFEYPLDDYMVDCIMLPTLTPTMIPTFLPTITPSDEPSSLTIYPTLSAREPTTSSDREVVEVISTIVATTTEAENNDNDKRKPSTLFIILVIGAVAIAICVLSVAIKCGYNYKVRMDESEQSQQIISEVELEEARPKRVELTVPMQRERINSESQYGQNDDDANVINVGALTVEGPKGAVIRNSLSVDDTKENVEPGSMLSGTNMGEMKFNQFNDGAITEGADEKAIIEARNKSDRQLLKQWLSHKVKLPQYYDILVQNGYDTLEIVKEIPDVDELKEIGIELKGHLLKLMKEIKELEYYLQ